MPGPIKTLRDWLSEPRLRDVDVEGDERIELHRDILLEKRLLREVFEEFYRLCVALDEEHFSGRGQRVELGAGTSLFKSLYPEIVSTDIKAAPHLDMVVDAQEMPFPDSSVRAFYAINCFHHLPAPQKFFAELERTLEPGGGCVLIEPYHGPVAARFYERVFDTEHFDKSQAAWDEHGGEMGAMRGANQALSYIVFRRDLREFERMFPGLEVVLQRELHNYLRYLLSGGLNFRQLAPGFAAPLIRLSEFALSPLGKALALHHVVVLRRKVAGA
jgi:SAM-dependent methyltransferase